MVRTSIVSEPILPEQVLLDLTSHEDGACLLFLGVVRDHNQGRAVSGLEYEAYRGMAETTLAAIGAEASHRFGTDRVRVLHRVGELRVGEVSTAIAVATPHREEAYQASRFILEEIKERLPIWKREHYLDGDSDWIGSGSAADPAAPGSKEQGEEGSGE